MIKNRLGLTKRREWGGWQTRLVVRMYNRFQVGAVCRWDPGCFSLGTRKNAWARRNAKINSRNGQESFDSKLRCRTRAGSVRILPVSAASPRAKIFPVIR